jgi:glucose/arabinose dehydrogenase
VVTGVRNAFGPTFDEEWGMVVTDNGPSIVDGPPGFDEVNLFSIGDNGGWPVAWGDVNAPGMVAPLWHSGTDPIAPTGVIVPRESAVPAWDGKVLWCNFNTHALMLIDPAEDDPEPEVVTEGCTFGITQDPLGRIVTTTANAVWVLS